MTASDEPPMKSSSSVTDEPWPGYEGNDTSMNNNTTADSQLLLLAVRRRVHDETMSNWTGSFDDPIYDYLNIPLVKVAVVIVYVVIIAVGVCGNSVVVNVVVRHRRLHTSINGFIICLVVSDFVLCTFSLPVQLHYQLTNYWVFGEALCRVIFAFFAIPMCVSTLMILFIAVDRYRRVVCHRPISSFAAKALIIGSVAASSTLALPVVAFTSLHELDDADLGIQRSYCVEEWPSEALRRAYALMTFAGQFGLPLAVSAALYWLIYRRLKRRRRPLPGRFAGNRRHVTTRILTGVVAVFVVCWTPWNVHSLLAEFFHECVGGPHFQFVDVLLKAVALSSAAINPFLYCWLNANFRQELESVTARLQLQVCRSCEKKVDSHAGIAAGPAQITLGPRDQLPLSDRPRHTSAQSNRQQLQHRVEVPGFTATLGQRHTVDAGNEPAQQSCSMFGLPPTAVGELLQLQTTLAIIEHRSASSTSSRSSKSNAQHASC